MKIFKYLLVLAIVIGGLVFAVGQILPASVTVERSTVIAATPLQVFGLVANHREFRRWSPWSEKDPDMQVSYSGPYQGVGSKQTWHSQVASVGNGSSTYTAYEPPRKATTQLVFEGQGTAMASFELEPVADGVKVVWQFSTELNSVMERYMGLLVEAWVGEDFESGLARLKTLAEAKPAIQSHPVSYSSGGLALRGFYASPVKAGTHPGVLVVHEWWGSDEYARSRAEQLAELGYNALALDMYGNGKQASHPGEAKAFAQAVASEPEVARARFLAALELLKEQPDTDPTKLAAIGYCFGGSVVISMARQGLPLAAAVSFHGGLGGLSPINPEAQPVPLLVLNGADDTLIAPELKSAFRLEMQKAEWPLSFVEYPGARHSFTNPMADAIGQKFELPLGYHRDADSASWRAMKDFLKDAFTHNFVNGATD